MRRIAPTSARRLEGLGRAAFDEPAGLDEVCLTPTFGEPCMASLAVQPKVVQDLICLRQCLSCKGSENTTKKTDTVEGADYVFLIVIFSASVVDHGYLEARQLGEEHT